MEKPSPDVSNDLDFDGQLEPKDNPIMTIVKKILVSPAAENSQEVRDLAQAYLNTMDALHVIEDVVLNRCDGVDHSTPEEHEKCLACQIYGLAHAYGTCHDGCPVKLDHQKEITEYIKEIRA